MRSFDEKTSKIHLFCSFLICKTRISPEKGFRFGLKQKNVEKRKIIMFIFCLTYVPSYDKIITIGKNKTVKN